MSSHGYGMPSLGNKNILVTGANRGIGAACAISLAREGARIACADIARPDNTLSILEPGTKNHLSLACDVSDETSVTSMFRQIDRKFGDIDTLVHCAGIIQERPLLETSTEDFDRVIGINLRGSFLVGRESIRRMQGREGRVILTASDLAYQGRESFSPYVASKHGVLGLARSWAAEFAPRILVNALCPGPIDTAMLGAENMTAEWRARELDIPLQRFGSPDEIAEMVVFLTGSRAGFITGQGIGINGGSVMA
jgi:3-oxoacyl-[acyl-carrier protein] reductase